MKYDIQVTATYKKDYKKIIKRGKNPNKLKNIITMLASGEQLDPKYRDHTLTDSKKFINCRECHIEPDWLLVYKKNGKKLILLLVETGSHSDLF